MALTSLFMSSDYHGNQSFLRNPPGSMVRRVLAAGTAETITIPTDATKVIFSADADFYVRTDGSDPTVPSADDTEVSELNPAGYDLTTVSNLRVISPSACKITMAFYKHE